MLGRQADRQTLRHAELVSGSHNRSIKEEIPHKNLSLSRDDKPVPDDKLVEIAASGPCPSSQKREKKCFCERNEMKRSNLKTAKAKIDGSSRIKCKMTSQCKMTKKQGKNAAFTLAEVLITLTIIGVVAAITIPPLINNIQDAQYKTAYKKAYSILNQALTNAISDNALENPAGPYSPEHWQNFKTIMSYIKTQKTCLNYDASGYVIGGNTECWKDNVEGWNMASNGGKGFPANYDMSVVDISGMNWALCARGFAAYYMVDTNGFKTPNQMGKDRFLFIFADVNGNTQSGTPIKIIPVPDNNYSVCNLNKCGTVGNKDYNTYFGTSWLYK